MKKAKTCNRCAEVPVRLRMRKLQDGGYSLYVDGSKEGRGRFEFLRLYLAAEGNDDDSSQCRGILLKDYLEQHKRESRASHRGSSYVLQCQNMGKKLREFLGRRYDTLRMAEIDVRMVRGFIAYLRQARSNKGTLLSGVSIHHYFSVFKSMLVAAMKDEVMAENPIDRLKRGEIPSRPAVVRDFLDATEVALLAHTACGNEEVKRAFLFSCLTGLRISDIRQLRWDNLQRMGGEWYCLLVMQKTQEPIACKLSTAAVALLEPRGMGRSSELVFRLPCISCIERGVKRWAQRAGITKHVTFHTARHSYATMALMAGADLYTISRLLGHKNIRTTTMYATVVDAQRDAATDSVSHLFQQHVNQLAKS